MTKQIIPIDAVVNLTAPAQVENQVVDTTPKYVPPVNSVPASFDAAQNMDELFHMHQEGLRMITEQYGTEGDKHDKAVEQLRVLYDNKHAALAKEQP